MSKQRYIFNSDTLRYEPVVKSNKDKLKSIAISSTVIISLVSLFIMGFNPLIGKIVEQNLQSENEIIVSSFNTLDNRLNELSSSLKKIEYNDDYIYRPLVNKEPVEYYLRHAGFGGTEHNSNIITSSIRPEVISKTLLRIEQLSYQLQVQSKSYDEVLELALLRESMLCSIPSIQPLSDSSIVYVSSSYGYRSDPISKKKTFHNGIDFVAPIGAPVYASGDGKVIKAKTQYTGYGKHIIIDHGFGYQSVYGHLSGFNVTAGTKVKRGDLIGFVGNTGKSTGAHLHYEIRRDGKTYNPINYYQKDLTIDQYNSILASEVSKQNNTLASK